MKKIVKLAQGRESEKQFFRTTGGVPSGPHTFQVPRSGRKENTSLEEILIAGMSE